MMHGQHPKFGPLSGDLGFIIGPCVQAIEGNSEDKELPAVDPAAVAETKF